MDVFAAQSGHGLPSPAGVFADEQTLSGSDEDPIGVGRINRDAMNVITREGFLPALASIVGIDEGPVLDSRVDPLRAFRVNRDSVPT